MSKSKAVQVSGVYDRADYESLRAARTAIGQLVGKLDKARACGVDCSGYEQMRAEIDAQLAAIEQHFMTPPPN